MSCYLCRQVITGYDHFGDYGIRDPNNLTSKKCRLDDAIEKRMCPECDQNETFPLIILLVSSSLGGHDEVRVLVTGILEVF